MLAKKQILLIYLLLTAAALLAFWQVIHCDFVNFDDPLYVTDNIHVKSGITLRSIQWAFTTGDASNWHPLTWMSHMLDVQLFGLNPLWHHLTNLLFHIANTLLVFFLFHRMTKAPLKSAFVAALFAVHPLHVESVAWVAERKDVLSTFFWMLTTGAYVYYVELPSRFRYSVVVTFFVLGLLAKPMLVTLPFVLLLLDYWPLRRLQGAGTGEPGAGSAKQTTSRAQEPLSANKIKSSKKLTDQIIAPPSVLVTLEVSSPGPRHPGSVHSGASALSFRSSVLRPLLQEKIPLIVFAALSCIVTYIAQKRGGSVVSFEGIPPGVRIANAFVSYIFYIGKTIWPNNLAVFYPHPGSLPLWQPLGAVLLLIAVTVLVIRTAKRLPYLTMGWLWFTGTLVPVIGIVQVGGQALADRYTYIPLIGLFIMAAWGIPDLLKKWRHAQSPCKEALFASSSLVFLSLFIVTWTQVPYWRNDIALYDHSLKVAGPSDVILCNRGLAYGKLGNQRQAISDYDRAMEINPEYADVYNHRGIAYDRLGNQRQAISDYGRAIQINPEYADAYNNRGIAYDRLGDQRQAISDYDSAIEINPEYGDAYNNRGSAYDRLGNQRQAISDYDRAIEINPERSEPYNNRGMALGKLGNLQQAISDYNRAIEINPKYAYAYHNRGMAYGNLGNHRQAISDFDRAVEINPEFAGAYNNRGVVYGILGNNRQAISDFDRTIEIDPNFSDAYGNRGIAYAELGNQRQAISDYDRAIEINPQYAGAYHNRGIAYAKLGEMEQAIEDMQKAARLDNEDAKILLKSQGITW